MDVHPTAVIAEGAELGEGVHIGPHCVLGPHVRLGAGCRLHAHVVIEGDTEIGPECELWPHVVLGAAAQHRDIDSANPGGSLRIGSNNRFREMVTVNTGTPMGRGVTRIGNHNFLLTSAHVAHDCIVGDHVTMTNCSMAAGHTLIEDRAVVGAGVGLHQFARVGRLAMLGGGAMVTRDALPFAMVQGDRARVRGVNLIGMRRAGIGPDDIATVKRAYRMLFWRPEPLPERVEHVRGEFGEHPLVAEILRFLQGTRRGVLMARGRAEMSDERYD